MNKGLGNLLIEIGNAIKRYEEINQHIDYNDSKLLKLKEVLKLYPILTTYGINEAVKKGLIPVVKRGKLNFYDSKDIENYLTSLKKNNTNISSDDETKSKNTNSKIKFV